MDIAFAGNALLFLSALGVQFGLFDGLQSGTDASTDESEAGSGTDETEIVPIEFPDETEDPDSETGAPDAPTGEEDPATEVPDTPAGYDPGDYATEVQGTDGDDTLEYVLGPTPIAYFLQEGDDVLNATPGNDFADGGTGDDFLRMRLGDDIASGGDGQDTIDGGLGSDTLFGGAGDDSITGSKGDDALFGDDGNDIVTGSDGNDSLDGGSGDDQLYGDLPSLQGERDDGSDTLIGGEGDESLHVAGGDQAEGGEGADSFFLYDPTSDGSTGQITDFNASEDMIAVFYSPQADPVTGDPVDPVVSVTVTGDGTGAVLSLNGVAIGTITGGQGLTADDIALIAA